MTTLQKIVVPTDFSDASWAALDWVRWQTQQDAAEIHLLTVVEQPLQPYFPVLAGDVTNFMPSMDELMQRANSMLTDAIEHRQEHFAQPLIQQVRTGRPEAEIAAYAEEIGAELIVIAARGHNPLARILIGDTAAAVVRQAHCPVVVVKVPQNSQPAAESLREEFDELRADLRKSRAELRRSVRSAGEELREEWEELEDKWDDFNEHLEEARHEAANAGKDVRAALSLLASELKRGYKRVRDAL